MFQESVVEVFTSQMGITSSSLDSENTTCDVEEGDIERSSTEIENENDFLGLVLRIETIGNSSSGGFIDDTKDLKACDGTGILGS
jgi:hypothetical protein